MNFRGAMIFPVLVWLAAETVLQVHGLRFWAQHGGWHGWMWSLALGVVAVWFWLHPVAWLRWLCGGLVSVLLLLGPLWQVGAPLVESQEAYQRQRESVALRLQLLQRAETDLNVTLRTYLRNSETRSGWAAELARVQQQLAAVRSETATLAATPPAERLPWLSVAVIWIQLAALFVLQVAAVAALNAIRKGPGVEVEGERAPMIDELSRRMRAAVGAVQVAPQVWKHSIPTSEPSVRSVEKPDDIRAAITSGAYGLEPTVRGVMAATRRRHDVVGPIFHELLESGVLVKAGRGYRLEAAG